jgi:dihydropyrimidinase
VIDLLVRGGCVVTPAGVVKAGCDVAVDGGRIVALGRADQPARRTVDASSMLVLPGLVDAHVHLGCSSWDAVTPNDWYHGTAAAAVGGVTTVVDFATQTRGRLMMEAVDAWRSRADPDAVIDYGLHLSITDASSATLDEISRVVDYGIPTFKMFTIYRSHGIMLEDDQILEVCRRVHECGGLPGVHAENAPIAERNYARFAAKGLWQPHYHALAKPDYVEAEAINRVLFLARVASAPLYIYHLSTALGLELVRQARAAGQAVLAETCTHYLTLSADCLDRPDGVNYICSPPLRSVADQRALWQALSDGAVALVSTDEAGYNAADKARALGGPLEAIPNGLPGVELRLPVLYTQGVEGGRLSLERFVELNCTNPARVCGLYPRKGVIAPGSDADLIVIDPGRRVRLGADTQHMPVDWCAYDGLEVAGYPQYTVARGQVIVDDYVFCGARGRGEFVPGRLDWSGLSSLGLTDPRKADGPAA